MIRLLVTCALLLPVAGLAAHPGHGAADGASPLHYLTSAEHLVLILALALAVGAAAWGLRRSRRR